MPLLSKAIPPEHQTPAESAVRARDMSPWPFAPTEDQDVRKCHECNAEELHDTDREDRVLSKIIRVVHDVDDQRDYPE